MKVLLDHNMPHDIVPFLSTHEVATARRMGRDRLKNENLIQAGEDNLFEVFVTCDKDIQYQQNLSKRTIAIVHLRRNNWPSMEPHIARIVLAIDNAAPGSYQYIDYPYSYQPRKKR